MFTQKDEKPVGEPWSLHQPRKPWKLADELKWTAGTLTTSKGEQPILTVVKENLSPAFTVALISLPLSSALAIASNSTPMMGIATSFWSGLVMGIFGSSDFNVVGCSGALSPMVSQYIVWWGPDVMPYLSFVSAIFLVLFRLCRLDKYLFHMPPAVFEGFCIAVALIIGLNQLNFACGLKPLCGDDAPMGAPCVKHSHFYQNVFESLSALGETHVPSLLFTVINTGLMLLLLKHVPKVRGVVVPWIPVSAFFGCLIGWLVDPDVGPAAGALDLPTLKTTYGLLEPKLVVPLVSPAAVFGGEDALVGGRATPLDGRLLAADLGDTTPGVVQFVIAALKIAFVCALETVLSAKIASVRRGDHPFDQARELAAVSFSHFVQGITGTLPNTGLFLRTSANVMCGATHRMSQLLHVLILGVITVVASKQFSYLPQAGAAAILITGSIRMVPYAYLGKLLRVDRTRLALCALVTLASVLEDPVVGLLIGMFVAYVAAAKGVVDGRSLCDVHPLPGHCKQRRFRVVVNGPVTYITGEQAEQTIKQLRGHADLVEVDLAAVTEVDTDGVASLESAARKLREATPPCEILFTHVREGIAARLRRAPTLAKLELSTESVCDPESLASAAKKPVKSHLSGVVDSVDGIDGINKVSI